MGRLGKGREVRGVEAGSPGGHSLKQGRKHPLPGGHPVKFQIEPEGGDEDQQGGGKQNHLALHPVALQVNAVGAHIVPGQKADAAGDDEGHHGDADDGVGSIGGQRGILPPYAHQVQSRVAESGYRMKQGHPQPLQGAEIPAEYGSHHCRAQQFRKKGHFQNEAGQPDDTAHFRSGNGFLYGGALHQTDPPPGENGKERRHGDDAQAADLDQQENDNLAEDGPVGAGVLDHQSRDANRGGGGKQRVQKGGGFPGGGGKRQHQQPGSSQNNPREAQHNALKGIEPYPFPISQGQPSRRILSLL